MITAHIEDVTILQLFGNSKQFEKRVNEYCQREGLTAHYVQDMKEVRGL